MRPRFSSVGTRDQVQPNTRAAGAPQKSFFTRLHLPFFDYMAVSG
jgi:hypothetical protein